MYSSCPCCGEMDGWHFQSGVINGEPIEPGEFTCERCGFVYTEHVKRPMSEAALKFAPIAVANIRHETFEKCAKLVDTYGYDSIRDRLAKRIRALDEDHNVPA